MSSPTVPMTTLGPCGIGVSRLALGSWRTYERITRDQGIRVMLAAREAGINFLSIRPSPPSCSGRPVPNRSPRTSGALELAERLTPQQRDRLAAITGHVG